MEYCNTVSLYTIKLTMIIQGTIELRYNIRSAWFLDIRISTCFVLFYVLKANQMNKAMLDISVTLCTTHLSYTLITGFVLFSYLCK